jgi:hypothetical protein
VSTIHRCIGDVRTPETANIYPSRVMEIMEKLPEKPSINEKDNPTPATVNPVINPIR